MTARRKREQTSVVETIVIDGMTYSLLLFPFDDDRVEARDATGKLWATFTHDRAIIADGEYIGQLDVVRHNGLKRLTCSVDYSHDVWAYKLFYHGDIFIPTTHRVGLWRGVYLCELEVLKVLVTEQKDTNEISRQTRSQTPQTNTCEFDSNV